MTNSTLQAHRETPQVYPTATHTENPLKFTPPLHTLTEKPLKPTPALHTHREGRQRSVKWESGPKPGPSPHLSVVDGSLYLPSGFPSPLRLCDWPHPSAPYTRYKAACRSSPRPPQPETLHYSSISAPTQTGCEVRSNNTLSAPTARLGCRPWLARLSALAGLLCLQRGQVLLPTPVPARSSALFLFFFSFWGRGEGGGAQRGCRHTPNLPFRHLSSGCRQPALDLVCVTFCVETFAVLCLWWSLP